MRKILVSITTTSGSGWREKIKEIEELKLSEAALFPTCLEKEERQEMYSLLEKSGIKNIPLVHIRNDMNIKELDYFINRFGSKAFNLHSNSEYPFIYDYSKHGKMIFIENIYCPLDEKEIEKFGGICLDVSHLENDRIHDPEKYEHNLKILEKYPIGCNHLSAFQKTSHKDDRGCARLDSHSLVELSEMDYLKKYPKKYFSDIIAIELENSIKEQLKIKDYLIKKIGL
ncbi:MAG: hypothetical protein Q8P74_01290 [bacterium]|nr:hypothetical protein [bacterium]